MCVFVWKQEGLLLRGNCASHLKLQILKYRMTNYLLSPDLEITG